MKKLFLLCCVLSGCSYATYYIPENLGYNVTNFDKETQFETELQYELLDECGKAYVDYIDMRLYEVMSGNEDDWKQCSDKLNYAQRKIWSRYWALEGWKYLYKSHDKFCGWMDEYRKNGKDLMKDGAIAWIMASGYFMERNMDICSTSIE